VAASCPQCHAAVVPGMLKCQFCGAPVEYIEPAAAESEPEPPLSQEAVLDLSAPAMRSKTAKPSAQEKKPSRAKRKKSPASVLVQVAVGVAIIGFFYFVVSHLLTMFPGIGHIGGSAGITASPEPDSSPPSESAAGDLGVDIYPGVRTLSQPDHANSPDRSSVSAVFVTDDSMDKVIAFYKARMVGQTTIYASGDGVVVSISHNPQESIVVTIGPAQSGGKTKISIAHTTTSNQ